MTDTSSQLAGITAADQICRRREPDLYFATFFLSGPKRSAVRVVAAFCRMIGEAISTATPDSIDLCVDRVCDLLDAIYADRLELPAEESRDESQHVLSAVCGIAKGWQIPKEYFLNLAQGYRADAVTRRYATWSSLRKHLQQTGGVVARTLSCLLGVTSSDVAEQVIAMGSAIRLTRILRDIKSDWDAGRLYLPLEDLPRFKYAERELAAGVANEQLRELMRFEIDRARQLYREAAPVVCWLAGDGSRMMAATVAVFGAAALDAIANAEFNVFHRPPALSIAQRVVRLPRAWRLARRREAHDPVPPVFD